MEYETALEALTVEQAPESIFDRAKRHMFQTLSYLSCSSRRKREKTEQDLDTDQEHNMIDCLPKEMLSHITSFLPPKDFNSLVRTNKSTHSRLRNRDRQPLHVNMEFRYNYEEENRDFLNADIFLKSAKGGSWFEFAIEEANMQINSQPEQMGPVADWYYNESLGVVQTDLRTIFYGNLREMLLTHLRFLISSNVVIDQLTLVHARDVEVDDLTVFLKENRMRVTQLDLEMDVLSYHYMDLIHVCRPNSIIVRNAFVPSTLHQDQIVRKLRKLRIYIEPFGSKSIEMKEGDLAAYYSITNFQLHFIQDAPVQDMKLFIDHWISSTRIYEYVGIHMVTLDPEFKGIHILEQLDSQLVEVKDITTKVNTVDKTWFYLRRVADGCELFFGWIIGGNQFEGLFICIDSSYDSSILNIH